MCEIDKLATALAKAQGEILPAPKDANNPFFNSKYATLPAIREAVREVFAKHGLSVVQMPSVHEGQLRLKTVLLHSSGQSLDCGTLAAEVDVKNCQKAGSAISYFRRYALAAVSQTVSDTDDDAEKVRQPDPEPEPEELTPSEQNAVDRAALKMSECTTLAQLETFVRSGALKPTRKLMRKALGKVYNIRKAELTPVESSEADDFEREQPE